MMMTGEMSRAEALEDAELVSLAKRISKNLGFSTAVHPWDQYQGAYIAVSLNTKNGKYMKDGLGGWNMKIWHGDAPGFYTIEYKGDFDEDIYKTQIFKAIRAAVTR